MEFLKFRITWINAVMSSLNLSYTELISKELRDIFPDFEFSKDSFYKDVVLVKNIEVQTRLTYSDLEDSLKMIEKKNKATLGSDNGEDKKQTNEELEINVYDSVAAYNRTFKTSERVKDLNALEYAVNCRALDKYIEDSLESQNSNQQDHG